MSLEARGLAVELGGAEVLCHVSGVFHPGTITAICGPNGAGKSTLLSTLAGLVSPWSGEVLLDGTPLPELAARERARRVGYLPQMGEIAWDVSVANLVQLGRLPHRDAGEAQVISSLEAVDMLHLYGRPVSTLSGGEKARALLARVLAGEPRWILADEPLAALDLSHQLALLHHLRAAAKDGTGVVLVLHDLALAMNHADRVLVLDRGHVAAHGSAVEALSAETIERVWHVSSRWLGEPGARALVVP